MQYSINWSPGYTLHPEDLNHIIGNSYLLTIFNHFSPYPQPLWQPPICSLYLWGWLVGWWWWFRFHMWDHMAFVFIWLTILAVMPSRTNHVVTDGKTSFFYSKIFHWHYIYIYIIYIYIGMYTHTHLISLSVHPSVDTWMLEHGRAYIFLS